MTQMPTGAYVAMDAPLHGLDARAKLLCFLLLVAGIVASSTVPAYAVMISVIVAIALLSKLPFSVVVSPAIRLWRFGLIIFLMNALFYVGDTGEPEVFRLSLKAAGMAQGARVVGNMMLIMVLSNMLTASTRPMDITSAIGSLLSPLAALRIPVGEVSMILGIAMQFIPTLLEETDMIRKAQIARGARFDSRNLVQRAQSYLALLVPIFIAAFRRADELSCAMEARGYRNASLRTKQARVPLGGMDVASLALCCAICALSMTWLR